MRKLIQWFILCLGIAVTTGCAWRGGDEEELFTPLAETAPATQAAQEVFPELPAYTATPTVLIPAETDIATDMPASLDTPMPTITPVPTFPPQTPVTLTRIDMVNLNEGWGEMVIDEQTWALLRTADGGQHWEMVNPPRGYAPYSRFFALDGQTAWAAPALLYPGVSVENGFIWRTRDGGKTWQASQPLALKTNEQALVETFLPSSLFFLDANHGWLVVSVGHYMNQDVLVIFSTQDGGETWSRLTDKFQAGQAGDAALPCQVLGIGFINPDQGWLAGNCLAVGVDERWSILATQDGGRTWQSTSLPAPSEPAAVLAADAICASNGVQVMPPQTVNLEFHCLVNNPAGSTPTYSILFSSADGGKTWNAIEASTVSLFAAQGAAVLGPQAQDGTRSLLATRDGGATWTAVKIVTWPEAQLDFVDSQHGWAVARRWNSQTEQYDYALVVTTNGGERWELIDPKIK